MAEKRMTPTLALALAALAAWILLLLLTPVTTGVVHLLLALGVTLLVRWWALRE
jgi:hypothetical protein